jgi:hypothetical protein
MPEANLKCWWCGHRLYPWSQQVFVSGVGPLEAPAAEGYPLPVYPSTQFTTLVPMMGCKTCGRQYAQVLEGQEPVSPYVEGTHRPGWYATVGGGYAYSAQPAYSATIVAPGEYVEPWQVPKAILLE